MEANFFKPWYNEHQYNIGINGKKILVVGASHYCKHTDQCPYFEKCTSRELKDSSSYNKLCPYCDSELSHTTVETVEYFIAGDANKSYRNFSNFMINTMKFTDNDRDLWEHIAFMNYVQFMLGGEGDIDTNPSDISDRDFEVLKEVVCQLTPDIIIVWGSPVGNILKKYSTNRLIIQGADYNYIFEIKVANRTYTVINCYHPCDQYGWFSKDIDNLQKQLSLIL